MKSPIQERIKYALDRVVAAVLLVLLSPVFLIVGILIKLQDGGAVFFRQERVGQGRRPFVVWKFRTMVPDADRLLDERGVPRQNRVTRVGALLRATSLDELPQLINILKGEMSFVGPRPVLPGHLPRYKPEHLRRFEMKPGITGLAQINGRNTLRWSQRLTYDVQYIEGYSLWLDLTILLRTAKTVALREGTVGDRNPEDVDDLADGLAPPLRREEPAVAPAFEKNREDEAFLETLNRRLAPFEEGDYRELPETHPTLHIVGVPRSGTTLLNQLIASCLDVGYVNHLIAAFWQAPVHGIRLSQKLLRSSPTSSYQSQFGRTRGIHEPHEFGYFWTSLLNYPVPEQKTPPEEDSINWERFRRVMINMSHAFGKPAVYKSFYLGWHIARAQQELSSTCFVHVTRDPVENVLSILKLRREFLGSVEKWASLRPAQYEELRALPYHEQAAGQVYHLRAEHTRQLEAIGYHNSIHVDYRDLCERPGQVVERVRELLAGAGAHVARTNDPPADFTRSGGGAADEQEVVKVRRAVEGFFGSSAAN